METRIPTSNFQLPTSPAKLVVIVGETASGKSALGIELAQIFDGEIICADSRTVYRGMDIGTAKPTKQDQTLVPHHLLDIVNPDKPFTAADFKGRTLGAIEDIIHRGKLPIMVGGTGLYVDSVLYDFQFLPPVPLDERQKLNALGVEELQTLLQKRNIPLPKNAKNPRHLVRALETDGIVAEHKPIRPNTLVIGLQPTREQLEERVRTRVNTMIKDGFTDEVKRLMQHYSWELDALRTPGYKAFRDYIEGTLTLDEAKERFVRSDLQLAKRQRTWFKRNKSIQWIKDSEQAKSLVQNFLSKPSHTG